MTPEQILKRPVITELVTKLTERHNQVAFEVDRRANKYQIRDAVEYLYPAVKVEKVRTMIVPGKKKRRGVTIGKQPHWKKAVVSLRQGDVIDFFAAE